VTETTKRLAAEPLIVPFGRSLRAAIVAGIIAGLIGIVFHYFVTQPAIDQAIAYALSHGIELSDEDVATASGSGLFFGLLMYSATWALFFGVAFAWLQGLLPTMAAAKRGLYLAAIMFWVVALPFLKYPGYPPGLGDQTTTDHRAAFAWATVLLTIWGSAVAVIFTRLVERRIGPGAVSLGGGFLVMAVWSALVIWLMPVVPDAPGTPLEITQHFQVAYFAALAVYWSCLASGFALQLRVSRTRATPEAESSLAMRLE